MQTARDLAQAIAVTAEVMGHEIRPRAAEDMALELASHDPADVARSLQRCKRELSGRLTLAAILERMPGQHLGAGEAWALCPTSEAETVVWTEQIERAFGAAEMLLREGDQYGARKAFEEAYRREVGEAMGQPPKWVASFGHDPASRETAVARAVELGRLTSEYARKVLPPDCGAVKRLEGGTQKLSALLPANPEAAE